MKAKRFVSCFAAMALFVAASATANGGAVCSTATWNSWNATTAQGIIDGISITATTSATAEFVGLANNHFGSSDPAAGVCGSWDGMMALTHDDVGVVASNVNAGDYQEFTFSSPLTDGLFYIENFDSSSIANITVTGATSISLADASASISFASTGANTGTLTTSNAGYNGEGDAALLLTGDVTSIRIDYTSGEGANGVFYTFAQPCAVPEPTSALVMAGLFGLGGLVYVRRNRK